MVEHHELSEVAIRSSMGKRSDVLGEPSEQAESEKPVGSPKNGSSQEDDYKMTGTLIMSIVISCLGNSFLFGYNIGVINQPKPLCTEFYNVVYYGRNGGDAEGLQKMYDNARGFGGDSRSKRQIESPRSQFGSPRSQFGSPRSHGEIFILEEDKMMNESLNTFLWSFTVAIFVATGFIGAILSAKVADSFGRKMGMIYVTPLVFLAAILGGVTVVAKSPECLILHRFFVGLQSGLSISICPMYLAEISPQKIRGSIGTCNQLAITFGILVSQVLGLGELLGRPGIWPVLFALVALPALVELICLPMLPESPRFLLIRQHKEKEARDALVKFRGHERVDAELEMMKAEARRSQGVESFTIIELLKDRSLRRATIIACTLMICQQWSGINVVMSYSSTMFSVVGIAPSTIPYAVAGMGVLNCLITLPAIPLMEKLGRWILLFFPTILMLIAFMLMMVFLKIQEHMPEHAEIFGYLCIVMTALYIVGFAVGFGPIPFLIVSEIFRQEPRAAAMSLCTACNWTANFILMLVFPHMQILMRGYVFLPFCIVIIFALVFVFFVVPETKNKTFDEIATAMSKE